MIESAPMWMHCGLTTVWVGKQMTAPSPNEPNWRATRELGPMAATRPARSHAQRMSSPLARSTMPRTRLVGVGVSSSRRSTARR